MQNIDNRTILRIVIVGLGVLVLFWAIYLLIPKSYLKFSTSPHKVAVLIDNNRHTVTNGETLIIAPGNHNVVVFEDEFNPYEENISIKNGETYNIAAPLTPLTTSAKSKVDNEESDMVIQLATGRQLDKVTSIVGKLYPITAVLPVQTRFYTVSSCASKISPNNPIRIALCVNMYPPYYDPSADIRSDVIKDLRSRGFNPNDYEIVWNTITT